MIYKKRRNPDKQIIARIRAMESIAAQNPNVEWIQREISALRQKLTEQRGRE